MRDIKRLMLTGLIVLLLSTVASAETVFAEEFNARSLWDALPADSTYLLGDAEPTKENDFLRSLFEMLKKVAEAFFTELQSGLRVALRLFFTMTLCQLAEAMCENKGRNAVAAAGALALMSLCLAEVKSMVGVGEGTMQRLADFSMALNPIMAAASAASGSVSGAGMNYGLTVFFSNILLQLSSYLIVPGIYGYMALGLTDAILREERLKRLRELIGWCIEHLLKVLVYGFTGCLTVTGVLTGAVDSAKLKAAKSAISGMIPVVGGIISGAAETILTGASVLKNTVGTFGLLAILSVFLLPFLKISLVWLILKVAAALGGVVMSSLTSLLETVSKAAGYLVAMTGSSALICLLSCCCYFKVVQL